MLVLSRKPEESIYIDNDIEVKIISISKDRVKIGIEAPKNISLIRGELKNAIVDANLEASKSKQDISVLKNISIKRER